ncbi:MAG TPA: M28 family peptidase [Candidatus Synoicihabitans sp.]|nr:M28 family peptidase [Candidatus Synoicihabitans sp.]
MRRSFVWLLATFIGASATPAPAERIENAAVRSVRAHAALLADDLYEGRATGTRGYQLAAAYVASQFSRLGLVPAGDDGSYLQRIRFLESTSDLEGARFAIHYGETIVELAPIAEAIVRTSVGATEAEVRAPAVFAGFGIHAPELGYDDFALVDLRGKIAVVLAGSPSQFPATARAHHSRIKPQEIERRGAVGLVVLGTPREEARSPWAFAVNSSRFPRMRLVGADGSLIEDYPALRVTAGVSRSAAEKVFSRAARPWTEALATSERGEAQGFDLGIELALAARSTTTPVQCTNVLALLPGSDPTLAHEPVVLTGHLDHIGIGPEVAGDTLYNGAYDNAVGIGILLTVAERLAHGPPSRRPVLIAAVTAEEKGLLGSYHLARHPPAGVERFAANLNVDMSLFFGPVRDVIARGSEHSTLGATAAAVTRAEEFTISPDPIPEEVVFVRSDQYSFVRTGVPAIFLSAGVRGPNSATEYMEAQTEFRRMRYHKPSDDLTQPIDWQSTADFARLLGSFATAVANEPEAPSWLSGDFFGRTFGQPH